MLNVLKFLDFQKCSSGSRIPGSNFFCWFDYLASVNVWTTVRRFVLLFYSHFTTSLGGRVARPGSGGNKINANLAQLS
jgi:hypothetical protein